MPSHSSHSSHHPESSHERFLPPYWLVTIGVLYLFGWLTVQLKEIVTILVIGYSVSYFLNPLVTYLEQYKISRAVGLTAILTLLITFIFLLGSAAIPTLVDEGDRLAENFPAYYHTAQQRVLSNTDLIKKYIPPEWQTSLEAEKKILSTINGDTVKKLLGSFTAALLQGYSLTLTLVNIALLPLIIFYFTVGFSEWHHRVLMLVPHRQRSVLYELGLRLDTVITAFIRGQLLVGATLASLYALGLGMLQVDLWFIIALVSGFGNLVPYLGLTTGLILSTVMALVTYGDISHIFWVWGLYAVVQSLEALVITPRIVGHRVGLSPLAVVLSIFAAGKLLGLLGIFLAVPLAACIKVIAAYLHEEWLKRVEVEE